MSFSNRATILLIGTLLTASACSRSGTMLPAAPGGANPASRISGFDSAIESGIKPASDETSILKKLNKLVLIGSTVDPKNGDKGARAVSVVETKYGFFQKGQVLVCNFEDKTGNAGAGTTIDVFDPKPGSKPVTFAESSKIEGCAGTALTSINGVSAAGATSGLLVAVSSKGKVLGTLGSPYKEPFSDVDASNPNLYAAEYIFGTDANSGGIISFSINNYGNPTPLQVVSGFAVNHKTGWSTLGPSGIQYWPKTDTLYVADGVDNTIVSFNNASELLVKDEIVVKKGGKTFSCKFPRTSCGKLIYSGNPLDGPVAMTLLPNGNLIAANTVGGNRLVELTPDGKILDTKIVGKKGKPAGVFGLAAVGSSDSNTTLFFTDTNSNGLYELEQ
ncbi:MAG: hypothetical protein WAK84_03615 [Candidatus Cybelea sp.]